MESDHAELEKPCRLQEIHLASITCHRREDSRFYVPFSMAEAL